MTMHIYDEGTTSTPEQVRGASRADSGASRANGGASQADGGNPLTQDDYHAIFGAAPNAMMIADLEGRILRINPPLEKMFGYTPGELCGKPSEILFPARYRMRGARMDGMLQTGPQRRIGGFDRDLTGRRKSGEEFPLELSLCRIAAREGHQLCATIIDVTERERAALRLREAGALLEQIAQVVSRDIHNQIHEVAAIVACRAESPRAPIPDDVQRTLRGLSECLVGVEHLLGDLTLYTGARHFPLKSETIDLGAVVDEAIALEAPGAGVSIAVAVPRETFVGARQALAGVLRSLLSNSIKHHDRGDMRIDIRARLEGDQCVIDYCDDGPGIPEKAQSLVFQLFQTLAGDESHVADRGSGMGLAIALRLAEGHGASISLTSRDGTRGSRFRIWWPRYPRADRAA